MDDSIDYTLSDDQTALVSAVQAMLRAGMDMPQSARAGFFHYDEALQKLLYEGGFLDAGRDMGSLEAALVVIEAARIPTLIEAAASAMVVPKILPVERVEGPVALVAFGAVQKPIRNLPIARVALIDLGDDVALLRVNGADVEAVDSILGYPFGRFRTTLNFDRMHRLGSGAVAPLRQWWRASLAAESAGAAQSAVAFTVEYVKQRQVFGRPVGSYQSVQHRLAQCHQIARGIHYLALKAAWTGDAQDADIAACYAQQHVQKFMFDLHQFNGAMGVTNEHLLHFWLYRLRALQAEAGGVYGVALQIADLLWGAETADGQARQ
jgi:hypothetical protein